MEEIIKDWKNNAERHEEQNYYFLRSLKMKNAHEVDKAAKKLHEEAFSKIDCKQCGNCCKTSTPILENTDVINIAKCLNIKEEEVISSYLKYDEDNDLVFNAMPCPFLNSNNSCNIYVFRPKVCMEYPHTNKKDFASRTHMHTNNTLECPATFFIVETMRKLARGEY